MSRKRFAKEQIEILRKNENVNKVTDKYIVFEADFKRLCLENVKKGSLSGRLLSTVDSTLISSVSKE